MPRDAQSKDVSFDAFEYRLDATFARAHYAFEGTPDGGWHVLRDGSRTLSLGRGYSALRTIGCGVCSTDLARQFLPFPLPQIIGHELIAEDERGTRYAVEINASHRARGIGGGCAFCAAGLETHCPDRLVLGIHDLPGGFGPWILAPDHALRRLPDDLPETTAYLLEPFAAALHAVERIAPKSGDRIAVLGPRRLGLLVLAALAAVRRRDGHDFEILALARRPELRERARSVGADVAPDFASSPNDASPLADVVIDTTGSPDGLALALALAEREVHLKSTHGQPAIGLAHTTELVVDELGLQPATPGTLADVLSAIEAIPGRTAPLVAWCAVGAIPDAVRSRVRIIEDPDPRALLARLEAGESGDAMPRVDAAFIDDPARIDALVRPDAAREVSPVRPRGTIVVLGDTTRPRDDDALARALARGVRVSSSRCGSFTRALSVLAADSELKGLGDLIVTDRLSALELPRAFERAMSPDCIKAIVEHPRAET